MKRHPRSRRPAAPGRGRPCRPRTSAPRGTARSAKGSTSSLPAAKARAERTDRAADWPGAAVAPRAAARRLLRSRHGRDRDTRSHFRRRGPGVVPRADRSAAATGRTLRPRPRRRAAPRHRRPPPPRTPAWSGHWPTAASSLVTAPSSSPWPRSSDAPAPPPPQRISFRGSASPSSRNRPTPAGPLP